MAIPCERRRLFLLVSFSSCFSTVESKVLAIYFEKGAVQKFFTVKNSNRSQVCNSVRIRCFLLSPFALHEFHPNYGDHFPIDPIL